MSLVYIRDLQDLDTMISMIRNIKGELVMANESKLVYALED